MSHRPSPGQRVAALLASPKSVLAVPDLLERLVFTLAMVVVYRVGSAIPTPGVNTEALMILAEQQAGSLFGLYNMVSGGNLARATILALGIMPFASAAVLVQLLSFGWPYLARLSADGELGRGRLTQYALCGTILVCIIQAMGIAVFLERQTSIAGGLPLVYEPGWNFRLIAVLTMTTGTVFIVWLGQQITERGVGNGMALIVFAGVVVNLPAAASATLDQLRMGAIGLTHLLVVLVVMVFITGAVVFLWCGRRCVTVHDATQGIGQRSFGEAGAHLPLKVPMSGIIPVSVASFCLGLVATTAVASPAGGWGEVISAALAYGTPLHCLVFIGLIVFFSYVYTAITFDPYDVAENLSKYGAVVPGIRPGKRTAEYIDTILSRTTLVWSIGLALAVILPDLMFLGFRADAVPVVGGWLNARLPPFITDGLGVEFYLGGTSVVIIVVVALDTVQQVESQLIRSRQPDSVEGSAGRPTSEDIDPARPAEEEYETFVPVFTPKGAAMVPFVESLLRSAGIPFVINNEAVQDLFGMGRVGTGFSLFTGAPTVCVEPTRAEEATDLLATIEAQRLIGTVVHYFAKPQVGVVELTADVTVGEALRFCGHGVDFRQRLTSMQRDHRSLQTASAETDVTIKVDQRVRAGTHVFRAPSADD